MKLTYSNFFLIAGFICTSFLQTGTAQELNVNLRVSTPQIQATDPQIFRELESELNDFLNNRAFTNITYENEERINCTFQLTIKEALDDVTFSAELSVQSSRPVFNSDYETTIINHLDRDILFTYTQGQSIQITRTSYLDNLSALLTFYGYLIIGMDYETFVPLGGEEYFKILENTVNAVPPSEAGKFKGWRAMDGNRNRYWIAENLMNPRVVAFREALYQYHRKGLDLCHSDPEACRLEILAALQTIDEVHRAYPNSIIVQMFMSAKGQEIVDIFSKATRGERNQVYQILSRLDPANLNIYRPLRS
nr:DUF4835 family protein [Saprospiraceae bacterium]